MCAGARRWTAVWHACPRPCVPEAPPAPSAAYREVGGAAGRGGREGMLLAGWAGRGLKEALVRTVGARGAQQRWAGRRRLASGQAGRRKARAVNVLAAPVGRWRAEHRVLALLSAGRRVDQVGDTVGEVDTNGVFHLPHAQPRQVAAHPAAALGVCAAGRGRACQGRQRLAWRAGLCWQAHGAGGLACSVVPLPPDGAQAGAAGGQRAAAAAEELVLCAQPRVGAVCGQQVVVQLHVSQRNVCSARQGGAARAVQVWAHRRGARLRAGTARLPAGTHMAGQKTRSSCTQGGWGGG